MTQRTSTSRPFRMAALATATALAVVGAVLAPLTPASAATLTVSTEAQLRAALNGSLVGSTAVDVVVLSADITTADTTPVRVARTVFLDLNGRQLTTGGVMIDAGSTLNIMDDSPSESGVWDATAIDDAAGILTTDGTLTIGSGTVIARGSGGGAGIGGGAFAPGGNLSITGGSVTAIGGSRTGFGGAGIGGGDTGSGGVISISGGTVEAIGGALSAGIGGGGFAESGTISISGGVVTATGSVDSAGIGAGARRQANAITISGGTVTAVGGNLSAGIGDGRDPLSSTSVVTIGSASGTPPVVTATTVGVGHSVSASALTMFSASLSGDPLDAGMTVREGAVVELGASGPMETFAPIGVLGTLTVASSLTVPSGITLTNRGLIDGSGQLVGEGTIANDGSICAPIDDEATNPLIDDLSGLTVTGNAFYLPYRYPEGFTVGNSVYAPTMQAGCRGFPDASIPPSDVSPGQINVGWSLTQDGSGGFVTETTSLVDVAPSKTGTFYPLFASASLIVTPQTVLTRAGETVTFTVRGPAALSNELSSDLTFFTNFQDIGQQFGDEPSTMTFTEAGEYDLRARVLWSINGGTEYEMTGDIVVFVQATELVDLDVEASATTVPQGGSVTLTVGGVDEFGNPITILPGDVVVTSDVATDIIDGLTVTFPTASPHTLTVTVGDVSATVVIEVEPVAIIPNPGPSGPGTGPEPVAPSGPDDDALAATGAADGAGTGLGTLALLLLTLGVAAVVGSRRTRIPSTR